MGINNGSTIIACAKGRRKTYLGYKWMYEEDYKKMITEQKASEKDANKI